MRTAPFLIGTSDAAPQRLRHPLDLHYVRAHLGYAHAAAEDATDDGPVDGLTNGVGLDVAHNVENEYSVADTGTGGATWSDVDAASTTSNHGTEEVIDNDDNDTEDGRVHYERCWRHLYICPAQGRYFGDQGSFIDFFDPLSGGETYCAQRNIPPFGPMIVWRVLSNFDCEKNCDIYDEVLEEGVTYIPVLFRQGPSGELHDILSDRPMSDGLRHGHM